MGWNLGEHHQGTTFWRTVTRSTSAASYLVFISACHLLKKQRVDVNEKAPSRNTALHAALNTGNTSMVQTLINAGAKVNACYAECATPYHQAIKGGNSEMVSAMLEAGCDKNAKVGIPATITPFNLATELELKYIICLLS
ncbi:PREDICTED: putative ankyrin repeat protein RBE_0997 [Acropora digitifera]|uniref:putative ankyrin repeat protein RBE_0997 n=1 Tax=Acropora digitifera TaxID=70779 RepID=UPI000779F1E4|nr:PREDICTED: putative ankyrin repeat protein RBE_0997 [Acropora digitifera]